MNENETLLRLSCFEGIGSIKIRALIDFFGSAEKVLSATEKEIRSFPKYGEGIASRWELLLLENSWKENLALAREYNVSVISYQDRRYPVQLKELSDFPLILYTIGDLSLLAKSCFAVVGSRECSPYSVTMAHQFASALSANGYPVVSGLARGIDTAAHKGAMEKGKTIAVLGSGLCHIYPKENADLAREIAKNGLLLSIFPMKTTPEGRNFLQRNRIVSAISRGVLLIEGAEKSGSMKTMEYAYQLGRKTYAIPGPIDNHGFKGNHLLIKRGMAQLVDRIEDLLPDQCLLFDVASLNSY